MCTLAFAQAQISYSFSIPFSTQLWIQEQSEKCVADLQELWGFSLSFPIRVEVERETKLGVRGEAAFDGERYYIFMNPSLSNLSFLIKHEMMHVFTFDWMWRIQKEGVYPKCPLWVMEGLAVWYEARKYYETAIEILPWIVKKEVELLTVEEYPTGDSHYRFYELLSDFFIFLDGRVDLQEHFSEILQRFGESEDWFAAFSFNANESFISLFNEWKGNRIFYTWVVFLTDIFFWGMPLLFVFGVGILILRKKATRIDSFDPELENLYGKEYWKKKKKKKEEE